MRRRSFALSRALPRGRFASSVPRASASSAAPAAAASPLLRQRLPNGRGWRVLAGAPEVVTLDEDAGAPSASMSNVPLGFLRRQVVAAMLPKGYPFSVTPNYLPYVQWTLLGLVTGRVQGVLATQAALYTIGVGAGAVPISAAVQWVLKDGVGHAAAIGYGTAINTRFDADAKRYRFQSTCALTVADVIACSMPFYPQHFFVMASAASAMSTTANVAQTASRARIMASFARRGNLADCVRCGQAHAKLMSLVGTGIGAAIGGYIGPEPYTLLALLVPLASTSLFSIHRASKLVVLRSLNVQRAERAFVVLIDQLLPPPPTGAAAVVTPPEGEALAARLTTLAADAPEAVAEREEFAVRYESILPGTLLLQPLVKGEKPLRMFGKCVDPAVLSPLLPAHAERGAAGWTGGWHTHTSARARGTRSWYALALRGGGAEEGGAPTVAAWHTFGATSEAKLQAVWHASVLRHGLRGVGDDADAVAAAAGRLDAFACAAWPAVLDALRDVGWDLKQVHLDGDGGFLERGGGE